MVINKLLGVIFGYCLCATASAATVWTLTDGDFNFLFTFGAVLAMFDDEDQIYAGNNLGLDTSDRVTFTSWLFGSDLTGLAGMARCRRMLVASASAGLPCCSAPDQS